MPHEKGVCRVFTVEKICQRKTCIELCFLAVLCTTTTNGTQHVAMAARNRYLSTALEIETEWVRHASLVLMNDELLIDIKLIFDTQICETDRELYALAPFGTPIFVRHIIVKRSGGTQTLQLQNGDASQWTFKDIHRRLAHTSNKAANRSTHARTQSVMRASKDTPSQSL